MTDHEKIKALISELTLDEKINMIHGTGLFHTGKVKRLGIPELVMTDGPMGVRADFQDDKWLPLNRGDDYVSYLPSNSALANTWNPSLLYEVGKVLGEEVRGRGKDVSLSPGINIKRNPLCGRNFEYFSEDPVLTAEMVMPLIKGLQETDVAACVKHFALNSQETERLWVNVDVSEKALREIYLYAFMKVCPLAFSIMSSYNLFRGRHVSENQYLLKKILRDEWKYDGAVISDWGAVHHTVPAANSALDIEMSVTNDFDNYCFADPLKKAIKEGKVKEEEIDKKIFHILLLLIRIHKIKLVETDDSEIKVKAYENHERKCGAVNTVKHAEICKKAAEESIVLLKNEDNILPLKKEKIKNLLVIGDNLVRKQSHGGGSAEIKALYEKTPMMGISALLGGNTNVDFVKGYFVPNEDEKEKENWQAKSLDSNNALDDGGSIRDGFLKENDENKRQEIFFNEAIEKAGRKKYDAVIFVGGLNHDFDSEGKDRENMILPYGQDMLIEKLLKIRPDMVIVIFAGSPVSMPWKNEVKALLYMSYSGMEGGTALAETIFGEINPSGKLSETFPIDFNHTGVKRFGEFPGRKVEDSKKWGISLGRPNEEELYDISPDSKKMDANLTEEYKDDVFVGYRYFDKYDEKVLFPFGYGLSYTEFSYGDFELLDENGNLLSIENEMAKFNVNQHKELFAEVTVENIGKFDGAEIVEIYLIKEKPSEFDVIKELVGFGKLFVKAGKREVCKIKLDRDRFFEWSLKENKFVPKHGNYFLSCAKNSKALEIKFLVKL